MTVGLYKELKVWHESIKVIKEVYKVADKLPLSEEYNLKQQLKRAVVSVSLNIVEGKNRKTTKDFLNFLNISFASLCEVDGVLVICEELGYIENEIEVHFKIEVLGKMLNALRKSLKSK